MHPAIEEHLGSRDVARVIYGSVIGMAVVVALEDHPPRPGEAVALLLGTALAVALAELYSELIGREARTRRRIHALRVRRMAGEAGAVAFGAAFPAIFVLMAAFGLISMTTAFRLAKWTGLGLICGYGYLAARLAGARPAAALGQALVVGAVGLGLIALKSVTH